MRIAGTLSGLALCLGLAVLPAAAAAQEAVGDTLEIYLVDVEGGEATLFVAPSGESLLVDTGWPGFDGRDADRIAAAAADAGAAAIDHLIVTHFHGDHMGGAHQLAERLRIGSFIDHGTTVDEDERPLAAFARYVDLRESGEHVVAAPGDRVPIEGLDVRIIASGGDVLDAPLPGAGGANRFCEDFTFHGEDITSRYGNAEDDQSISTFVGFGRFRTVIMGDLNWNREHALMCPEDRIGTVDLYLVSHHGSETSGSEALAHAIAPRAAVMNNGPRKGGAPQTFEILRAAAAPPDVWQNHYSIPAGDLNAPEAFIANLDEGVEMPDGRTVHMGSANWIRISARRDGSFTVTNSRNGFSRDYPARQ